jgi:hypothetical protein
MRLVAVIRVRTALSENSVYHIRAGPCHADGLRRPLSSRPWRCHRSSPSPSRLDRLRTLFQPREEDNEDQSRHGLRHADLAFSFTLIHRKRPSVDMMWYYLYYIFIWNCISERLCFIYDVDLAFSFTLIDRERPSVHMRWYYVYYIFYMELHIGKALIYIQIRRIYLLVCFGYDVQIN